MKSILRFGVIPVSLSLLAAVSIPVGATRGQAKAQEPKDGVRRISPAELREAWKKGKAILIDVRTEESYSAAHIKGARLIPVDDIGSRFRELPKNKIIATYCS